ncbi:MAG: hypothetical protein GY762_16970 [Proteobacteria bacterium]|nr:hypothetical protein [Pseudomonadota bacterium]
MKVHNDNNGGAVLVMALFVAVGLVGLVYHVSGVGEAALEQQTMQDAADATVFSAATVNARGMNILALLNLIMVACLTILIALRLVQALLIAATATLAVCCAIPIPGAQACCGAVYPLYEIQDTVDTIADEYEEVAKVIIKGLSSAGEAIKELVPPLALAEGVIVSAKKPYSPPANIGVVWPAFDGLPVKKGTYGELCKRAGQNVTAPMEYITGDSAGAFFDAIGGLLGGLSKTFSSYFCGDDGNGGTPGRPKKKSLIREVGYPPGKEENDSGMFKCAQLGELQRPDFKGRCTNNPCRDCTRMGCQFCLDAMKNSSNFVKGKWTIVQNEWVEWIEKGTLTVVKVATTKDKWYSSDPIEGNPCNSAYNPHSQPYLTQACRGYNTLWEWTAPSDVPTSIPNPRDYRPRPICETIWQEDVPRHKWDWYFQQAGKHYQESQMPEAMAHKKNTLYVALTSCIVEEKIDIEAKGDSVAGSDEDKEEMAPWVLDEDRYEDESTMMSVVEGNTRSRTRKNNVAIATHKKRNATSSNARFSFASAEYYSQNSLGESMWHMKWLSRLKRFKLDFDSDDETSNSGGSTSDGTVQSNNKQGPPILNGVKSSLANRLGKGVQIDDFILH